MNKPDQWFWFRANCKLMKFRMSNMVQPEQSYDCRRKDRKGNNRPEYNSLKCHWNVCPKLKEIRAIKESNK